MTLTQGPCVLSAGQDLLRDLARNWDGTGTEVRALVLATTTHSSLSLTEVLEVWDSYMGHLSLHDGINGIPGATEVHWSDVNDELTGPDRTEQARIEIAERLDDDEKLLLWGKR